LIVKFEGHYHGWGDEGLVGFAPPPEGWGPDESPTRLHPSAGVIPEVLEQFIVARWNDPEHLRDRVREYTGQIAAIVFEPCCCNTSCMEPVPGQLQLIRDLCDAEGALMIADETITGLRFGAGGAQGFYGFEPDLTVLGKAVGGGVPFAALVGKARFFETVIAGKVVHAGTLNGNPLCLAASRWCLDKVIELGGDHPQGSILLGRELMEGLRALADRYSVPLRPQGPGLVFHATMLKPGAGEGDVRSYRDYVRRHDGPRWAHLRRCLLENGVRAIERGLWFMSIAHTREDVLEALGRADAAFSRHAVEWNPS
jgi:glutamate-1-semialdehyde 2,1-aminomutase